MKVVAAISVALFITGGTVAAQNLVVPFTYDSAGTFHNGGAPVKLGDKWGIIDVSGRLRSPPAYDGIRRGGDGRFGVQIDGKWGVADRYGELVAPAEFDDLTPFQNGFAAARIGAYWAMIDPVGWARTPFIFREVSGWEGDLIAARDDEGWAIFNLGSNSSYGRRQSLGRDTQRAYSISEGSVVVMTETGDALIDLHSGPRRVLSDKPSIKKVSEGFAPFIDTDGAWAVFHIGSRQAVWKGRFDGIRPFSQGLAPARQGGKWGYIDRTGAWVLEPAFDDAYSFRNGFAVIRNGNKRGFLQRSDTGAITSYLPTTFDDAFRFSEGLAPVMSLGKWGYVSSGFERFVYEYPIQQITPQP